MRRFRRGTLHQSVRDERERDFRFDVNEWDLTDEAWSSRYDGRPGLIAGRIDVRR